MSKSSACPPIGRSVALCIGLAAFALNSGATASTATCADAPVAEKAGAAFISAARSGSAEAFSQALGTHADMPAIMTFALGKHRKLLPESEAEPFAELTKVYIARAFTEYRMKFKAGGLTINGCRGGLVQSTFEPLGVSRPHAVQWRVKDGKVVDVNVQNIWLGQLLRSQFAAVLNKSGGDLGALKAKLAKR